MVNKDSDFDNMKLFIGQALKQRWLVIGLQVAVTAAAMASLLFLPKQYRTWTTIKVEREKVINPLTRGLAVTDQMEERMRTVRQEIQSRNHLVKVISRLGLDNPGDDNVKHEAMLQQMKNSVSVKLNRDDSFEISFVGSDPFRVRDITNALAAIFIEESMAHKESEVGAAFEFLKEQLDVYRERLEESETALRLFEEKHVDELPATKAAHLARLEALKSSLDQVRHSIHQLNIQKDFLIRRIPMEATPPPDSAEGESMVANPLQARLLEKEEELRRLRQRYSDHYPDVIHLMTEIEDLRKEVAKNPLVPASEAPPSGPSTVQETFVTQLQQIDIELKTLATREVQLERDIEKYQKKIQVIPQVEQELARLKRDYDVDSDIYEMFLRRLEEARVSRELETDKKGTDFRVLEAAALPLSPYRPRKIHILLIGLAAGAGLNLLLIYFFQAKDTSFRNSDEIRKYLGLPVMVGIPRIVTARQKVLRWGEYFFLSLVCLIYLLSLVAFLYWGLVKNLFSAANGGV